jgi:hypothetical protein
MNSCKKCNKLTKNKHYCSKQCYWFSDQVLSRLQLEWVPKFGENNPNFGNKWTDEQKINQSSLTKSKVDDEYRQKCASANKGKKFDADRIQRMHAHRDRSSYSHPHTEENKKKIGDLSKQRFKNPEYCRNIRVKSIKTKEEKGQIIARENKSDWEFYWIESNWLDKFSYWDINDNTHELLKQVGVFNPISNKSGLVRDHIVSRKCGFLNKIFPELLRHPSNCQLLTVSENSQKINKPELNENIDELFMNINAYTGNYPEHNQCMELIKEYKQGGRWSR